MRKLDVDGDGLEYDYGETSEEPNFDKNLSGFYGPIRCELEQCSRVYVQVSTLGLLSISSFLYLPAPIGNSLDCRRVVDELHHIYRKSFFTQYYCVDNMDVFVVNHPPTLYVGTDIYLTAKTQCVPSCI
jgi:hypothetical protein